MNDHIVEDDDDDGDARRQRTGAHWIKHHVTKTTGEGTMKIRNETGQKLHDYMTFRAARERVPYELHAQFFTAALAVGIRTFFGIQVNKFGDLVADSQNPRAFAAYSKKRREA
jgi:hypothetical protein